MTCNNTTYFQLLLNNTEMAIEFHKHAFFIRLLNYNAPVAMAINKTVTPVWIIIGVFGNIVSAIMWSSPRMRTCSTVAYYLTCLAIADLTFLLLHLIYELEMPWLLGSLDVQGWCQIFSIFYIAVQHFCVFLVFAFTVERFLSVCHPFKSERFGKTRTPRVIFGLFVLAITLSLPQGYFWIINAVGECQVRLTERSSPDSFFSVHTWCTELAIFLVLPLIVLLLNIAVIHKIQQVGTLVLGKTSSLRQSVRTPLSVKASSMSVLVADNERAGVKRLSHTTGGVNVSNKGPTVTLLWVSFFLIFTVLPNTVVYAMQSSVFFGSLTCSLEDMSQDPTWRAYFSFVSVKIIVKEVSLAHHVGNVFIYMATSQRFLRLTLQNFCSKSRNCSTETKDTSLHTIPIGQTRSLGVDV